MKAKRIVEAIAVAFSAIVNAPASAFELYSTLGLLNTFDPPHNVSVDENTGQAPSVLQTDINWAMQWTPAFSALITDIDIALSLGDAFGPVEENVAQVFLHSDASGVPGPIIDSYVFTGLASENLGGAVESAASSLTPFVTAGTTYWISVSAGLPSNGKYTQVGWHLNDQLVTGARARDDNGGGWVPPGVATQSAFRISGFFPASEILFDFETAPNADLGNGIDPTFIDLGPDQILGTADDFTLSHSPGAVDGDAQWVTSDPTHSGTGSTRLSDATEGGAGPVTTTINFSQPVSSIDLWAANFFAVATITPILAPGSPSAPPVAIPVPATGMGNGEPEDPFTVTYQQFIVGGGGPYIGLELAASSANQLLWDDLNLIFQPGPSVTSVRDLPTPTGEDVTVIDLDVSEQVASEVVVAGTTDADFCVAPDPREGVILGGGMGMGMGMGMGGGPIAPSFDARYLDVAELAGEGTCTGLLIPDPDAMMMSGGMGMGMGMGMSGAAPPNEGTWEELLSQIDLQVSPQYRGYSGEFTLPNEENPTLDVWLVVGVVRSTAEFDGPNAIVNFPEALIDYSNDSLIPPENTPGCVRALDWRNLDVAAPVPAFGEFANVEDEIMIVETAQCNRSRMLGRRTTHVFPIRLDSTLKTDTSFLEDQFDGIEFTLDEADVSLGGCIASTLPSDLITILRGLLVDAEENFGIGEFLPAIGNLEQLAREAKESATGFDDCLDPFNSSFGANYRGAFMSRALTAAFTLHDRFLIEFDFENPEDFEPYLIPDDLDVPLLSTKPAP